MTGPEQVLVVGRVLTAHVADEYVLDPRRVHIDTPRLDLIARLHGSGWYARTTDTFQLGYVAPWRLDRTRIHRLRPP